MVRLGAPEWSSGSEDESDMDEDTQAAIDALPDPDKLYGNKDGTDSDEDNDDEEESGEEEDDNEDDSGSESEDDLPRYFKNYFLYVKLFFFISFSRLKIFQIFHLTLCGPN